ncbi:MAG TPA: 2-amino-4-hydroxy-6-hydroxymethyldihydropteridine diphosphokinase, partial [Alphaproteobacteria bacterium]|nr:2-amino-4-hydroxy-6-hydroxymethyldihydropteridine diphosphokinase [Alphaproteobacteria bacterium]
PRSDQPWFQNAVVEIETDLTPDQLITVLHEREARFGRVRMERNEARVLDIDILDFRGMVMNDPVVLPHPRMHVRAFVLRPLADLSPGWVHPVSGQSIAALIAVLDPDEEIEKDQ